MSELVIPEDLRSLYKSVQWGIEKDLRILPMPTEQAGQLIERIAVLERGNRRIQANRDKAESANRQLREALQHIADEDECGCEDHASEDCCNNVGAFCSGCIARAALEATK